MKTYFVDVTDIRIYVERETTISGIQRVSFEVIRKMVDRHGTDAVKLSYWDKSRREYLTLPSDFITQMEGFDPDVFSAVFFGKGARPRSNTPPTLERYRNRRLKYWFHYLRRSYHAARKNEGHFEKHGSSIAEWRGFGSDKLQDPEPQSHEIPRTPITKIAKKGDPIMILGATWAIDGLDDCFRYLAHTAGLDIRQLVHDLIPVVIPLHLEGDISFEFYRWLKNSTDYCAGYFANSKSTARDLERFLKEIGVSRPVQTVPLAQAFSVAEPSSNKPLAPAGSIMGQLQRTREINRDVLNLTKTPFVLVVGTMETRKNMWRLAHAWKRLAQTEGLAVPKLVFAGKQGWRNEDFNQMMQATGNLEGWIQLVIRPSDAELAFLYENCLFTAMVSFYEGWGLPIGEGLAFGKTAVVANNSSMPEVGGDMVEYCDAQSLDSIYAACRKLIENPDHRRALEAKIAATKLRSWDDVAGDFAEMFSK